MSERKLNVIGLVIVAIFAVTVTFLCGFFCR